MTNNYDICEIVTVNGVDYTKGEEPKQEESKQEVKVTRKPRAKKG